MRTYLLHRAAALAALALSLWPAAPAAAQTTYTQITQSAGPCGSFLPVAGTGGAVLAFESACSLDAAKNSDGSREIFRLVAADEPQQLTDGAGCTSANPVINANGSRIAFESDCDLDDDHVIGNADGNTEIFLWKQGGGGIVQLTASTACDNLSPTINSSGSAVIAFDSNCLQLGQGNADGSGEIFRVTEAGVITQLTDEDSGECDSLAPSGNASGSLYVFESDCDLAGTNPDFAIELFTVTSGGAVEQLTIAGDDACSSISPSMDDSGSFVAFESDCDFTDDNADASAEIFRVATGNGAVVQLTDDASESSCVSAQPRMAGSGSVVAFSSFCDLSGDNGDGSLEVFRVSVGGSPFQVTDEQGCSSVGGDLDTAGDTVFFDSDCDLADANADGSSEIFSAVPVVDCVCGAPVSHNFPPFASDALAVLKGAVGSGVCPLCACDVDDGGTIVASDALRVLRKAVGTDVDLTCPAP